MGATIVLLLEVVPVNDGQRKRLVNKEEKQS